MGNTGGVLEYDGVSWRLIHIPGWNALSLVMDNTGTIYIGGRNEIGFLTPDAKGALQYKSLCDKLTDDQKNFSMARKAHALEEGVYFRSRQFLFRWHAGQMKVWRPEGKRFNASFSCGGKLYIRQDEFGLMTMVDDQLKVVPGGEIFAAMKIFMIVPFDSQKMLIGTRGNGFFLYDGTKAQPFSTEADDYVEKNNLYHGIRLRSGEFAIATTRGGLVIIDAHGGLKTIFNEDTGLLDNNVKYVFQDALGNLWVALENGAAKIEYPAPISTYDRRSNLRGLVLSVTRHGPHNNLYAGTTRGLYYLSTGAGPGSPGKFHPVPGISTSCWSLVSVSDSLLAATSSGVFQVKHINENMTIRKVTGDRSFVLSLSPTDENRIWVGARSGLFSLYLQGANGQWAKEAEFEKINQEIMTIVEDKEGNLWLGTLTNGVLKAGLQTQTGSTIIKPGVKHYSNDAFPGLTSKEIHVFWAAGHVMFATRKGIYRFDNETGTFLPDFTLGNEFAGGLHGKGVFRITADKENKDIWLHVQLRNIQAIHLPGGTFDIIKKPFLRIPPAQVNVIYPDPVEDAVWFAGNDGLIRFDTSVKKNYQPDFSTLIRKVWVNGKPVFNGSKNDPENFFPDIEYKDRNLRFEFAAPFFEDESATQYQCLLEEYDKDWTPWSKETKDYTNIDPGTYTFRVRAKNVYEHLSREAVFRFKILTPWYRAWWAFLFYAIVFILMVFFIIRWRSGKLEREKRRLEQTVKERTKEIRERTAEIEEKNQQLEKQTFQLKEQSEKLKEMDKVKSRFFANISHEFRTPLTLIMGPLEQMLTGSRDKEQDKKINMMLRNSQRLLGLINQLLELSKFESGKVKLQVHPQNIIPFLKGIVAAFEPAAAENEVDLTFQTKEEEENITLYFDPEKLEEVLFNILANAVKFTPPAGRITVAAVRNQADEPVFPQGSLTISVNDTGPGIPRDQLSHIFDRFYQSDSTYEHHRKGSGIGLAIAKEIVELHQGKINVHSLEGKGTEFIIRLPLGKEHLKPDEIAQQGVPVDDKGPGVPADVKGRPVDVKGVPEDLDLAEVGSDEIDITKAEEDIDPFKQAKDIILVVEDSADVRDYIRGSLEPDYAVEEAKDGREGINKAQEIIPDLIISDIMMPEADGYELCRVLKNDKNTSHVPVILLTAKASEESILQGLETGADDYVTKPFNTKILRARIKNLIDLRRQMQANLNREMTLQPVKLSVSNPDKEFIRELQEVLEKNLSEPEFNVEELKKKLYMSGTSLYRKIQALSGQSPSDFIRSYRLKQAAQLLKSGFGSVTEVAFEVGFTSRAYFAKCFKETFHQTPSTFKESEASA